MAGRVLRQVRRAGTAMALVGLAAHLTAPATAEEGMSCVDEHWGGYLAKGPQQAELIERFALGEDQVLAFRLSPLEGDFAKVFLVVRDNGRCFTKAALVGSYAATQAYHAERQEAEGKPVTRLFHADLYEGETHAALGFFDGEPPSWDEVRPMLLEALK